MHGTLRIFDMTRRTRGPSILATLLAAMFAAGAMVALSSQAAQIFGGETSPNPALAKDGPALRSAAGSTAARASAATVRLLDADGAAAALGVAVEPLGFVVTKASEIDDGVQAEVPLRGGGTARVPGRIVGVTTEHDLAAVRFDFPRDAAVEPADFADAGGNAFNLGAGQWLVSAAPAGEAGGPVLAVGNVSVGQVRLIEPSMMQLGISMGPLGQAGIPVRRVFRGGAADRAGLRAGDLILARDGVAVGTLSEFLRRLRFDRPDAGFALTVSRGGEVFEVPVRLLGGRLDLEIDEEVAGVPVTGVFPDSAAAEAGLLPRDLITRVGESVVRDGPSLREALEAYRAGDRVTLDLIREGERRELDVQLGDTGRGLRARFQNRIGGTTISRRAVDFPEVIQHDTVLDADRMGGPVVDLDGRLVGLNIARAGRVETYALPASTVARELPALLSGRLPASPDAAVDEAGLAPPQTDLQED